MNIDLRWLMLSATMGWTACDYPASKLELAAPSAVEFEESAYPVLLRDCGFAACHGTSERFFQVYGPGRERLSEATPAYAPATAAELDLTFARARSMLRGPRGWSSAPLLHKPLAESAGGGGHRGADFWKQNVYVSKNEAGYQALVHWARSSAESDGAP